MEPVDIYNLALLGILGVALAIVGIAQLVGAWKESGRAVEASKRRQTGSHAIHYQVSGVRSHTPSYGPSRRSTSSTDPSVGVFGAAAMGDTTSTNTCASSDSGSSGGGE